MTPPARIAGVWDHLAEAAGLPRWSTYPAPEASAAAARLTRFTVAELCEGLRRFVDPSPPAAPTRTRAQRFCPRTDSDRAGASPTGRTPLGWARFMDRPR